MSALEKQDTLLFKAPSTDTYGSNKESQTLVGILHTAEQDKDLPRTDQPVGKFKYGFINALTALGNLMANQVANTGKASPGANEAAKLANMVTEGAVNVTSPKVDVTAQKDTPHA